MFRHTVPSISELSAHESTRIVDQNEQIISFRRPADTYMSIERGRRPLCRLFCCTRKLNAEM